MNIKFHFRQFWEHILYLLRFFRKRVKLEDLIKYNPRYRDQEGLDLENYKVRRNMWGSFKLPYEKLKDFKTWIGEEGWVFQAPSKNYGVIGYPNLIFQEEPIKISDIFEYYVSYFTKGTVEKYRKFNTSFDFWLGKEPTFHFPHVTHEVMVWDDYFVAKPFGKFIEEVNLSGNRYRVYSGYIDKSNEELGVDGWNYTAFLKVDRTWYNTLNVRDVLWYLQDKGILTYDAYLLRCEFGNEIYNASGKMKIISFWSNLNGVKKEMI